MIFEWPRCTLMDGAKKSAGFVCALIDHRKGFGIYDSRIMNKSCKDTLTQLNLFDDTAMA